MAVRYFEDWNAGDEVAAGPVEVTRDAALAFAREYDPQAFHLDDAAGAASMFGRLAASGWQTAALVMRAIVLSGTYPETGLVGLGVDKLRWKKPVYPGDTLRVTTRVAAKQDRPGKRDGIVTFDNVTTNQNGDTVMTHTSMVFVPKRGEP